MISGDRARALRGFEALIDSFVAAHRAVARPDRPGPRRPHRPSRRPAA
ncbi:hypothetical protein [Clavibacter zhangzhiyongii]